jgi:glutamate racemase
MATPHPPQIGIFDSGIGGLSVLRAVQHRLPGAALRYIADSLHTPWGDRPAAWVRARCLQLAGWLIDDGAGLVLVACNTGTTQAMAALRERWPGHRFVGVEPGIKPAVAASRNHRVAVLATTGTLRSARLEHLVATHAGSAQVMQLPCPGLADAIEAAGAAPQALQQQLGAIAQAVQQSGADTVVLGCTHYPLVADALQRLLGPGTTLIDTAEAVARRVASLLGEAPASGPAPGLRLFSTANPASLTQAARQWLQTDAVAHHLALPGDAVTTPLP